MLATSAAAARPAVLPLFAAAPAPDRVSGLFHAATELARLLGQGRALDSRALRSAMEAAFGASDAAGAWAWKDAYEAAEAAQVLFLRKFGRAMRTRAGSRRRDARDADPARPSGCRRRPAARRKATASSNSRRRSRLGLAAAEAAAITPDDLVLEPSAGTGLLAIFAELAGAGLALNEIADTRAGLLARLYRECAVTRHNAEHIHDLLDPAVRPSVVLMNPPFSSSPHVEKRFAEAAFRHLASAFARLREGGRLVAITGHNVGPEEPGWREGFVRLQERGGRVVFSAAISPARPMPATARRWTPGSPSSTAIPADDPRRFPPSPGKAATAAELLDRVIRLVPPRAPVDRPDAPPRPRVSIGTDCAAVAARAETAAAAAQPRQRAAPSPRRRTRLRDLRRGRRPSAAV